MGKEKYEEDAEVWYIWSKRNHAGMNSVTMKQDTYLMYATKCNMQILFCTELGVFFLILRFQICLNYMNEST